MTNTMLQCCNVWWRGGSTLFTLDVVKTFPSFHHIITYRYPQDANTEILKRAVDMGVEVYSMPHLTEEFLKDKKPYVGILHSPGNGFVQVEPQKYPLFCFHHAIVRPWLPTKYDIFNSEYTAWRYRNLHDRMNYTIIPPCFDTSGYYSETPPKDFTIGIVLNQDKTKMDTRAIDITRKFCEKKGYKLSILGQDIPFLDDPREFYRTIDVLVHYPSPGWKRVETWGRSLTEGFAAGAKVIALGQHAIPEQFKPSIDCLSYLDLGCHTESVEDLGTALEILCNDPQDTRKKRAHRVKHAKSIAGLHILRSKLSRVVEKVANSVL